MGPVERAVRKRVNEDDVLTTPSQAKPFRVARITDVGVTMLFGRKETPTVISWRALEGLREHFDSGEWIPLGGVFDVAGKVGTVDEYLKRYYKRATAGWVAALLECAGVVEIDRHRPTRMRVLPIASSNSL
jgi:hypothetical protein